ncbi:MAG: class I SAM-dependent methyltransferase [Eubacteriales bacterium]
MTHDFYQALSPYYDAFNRELDYAAWADWLTRAFARYGKGQIREVLDLGCGTGKMTLELARRGFDMVGVDRSEGMLSRAFAAAEKTAHGRSILWLCQDMTAFELYGTVDAVVCCLDCINHLPNETALTRCFSLVHNYLVPDGLFIFDVNSPRKFETVYANQTYALEEAGVFCVWQNDYRPADAKCDFYLTLFEERAGGLYRRTELRQSETVYTLEQLTRCLQAAGMQLLAVTDGHHFEPPREQPERLFLIAKAIKE